MTNRKPGRPRIDKPPKIRARPKRIEGGSVVKVKLDPETIERLDRMAVDRLMTRAGILREMIEREATK